MIKTIFYKKCEDDTTEGDYYFNQKPYKLWLTLDNMLYENDGNIKKYTIDKETRIVENLFIFTEDEFSDDGIIRRVGTHK